MTENNLTKMLSEESERLELNLTNTRLIYETELCGWKDTNNYTLHTNSSNEPAKFRIRVVEGKTSLTRSASSKLYIGAISPGNDNRSNSPFSDNHSIKKKKSTDNEFYKRRITSFNQRIVEPSKDLIDKISNADNIIRIYKPSNPRRQRKPIKVFRIPRVEVGEEE